MIYFKVEKAEEEKLFLESLGYKVKIFYSKDPKEVKKPVRKKRGVVIQEETGKGLFKFANLYAVHSIGGYDFFIQVYPSSNDYKFMIVGPHKNTVFSKYYKTKESLSAAVRNAHSKLLQKLGNQS